MKTPVLPFVRSPYNYNTNQISDETGIDTGTQGGAKQSFKDEVDINTILKRFGLGYELPENPRIPQEGDFVGITTYTDAMNAVARSKQMFDEYPANIRTKFDNDAAKFVEFTLDPKNREEMKEMGLLSKEAIERDQKAAEQRKQQAEGVGSQKEQKPPQSDKNAK